LKRSNVNLATEAVPWMARARIEGPGEPMQTRPGARPSGEAGLPLWRPQPGEGLAGVIDFYTVSDTPEGQVRTVIVTEERTGEQVGVQLASTSLLSLFVQHQPHPGVRIDLRYRGHTLDDGYLRWTLLIDRPAPLELSPLGGEASDEAPWYRGAASGRRRRRIDATPTGSRMNPMGRQLETSESIPRGEIWGEGRRRQVTHGAPCPIFS